MLPALSPPPALLLGGVIMPSPALSVPGMAQDTWEPKEPLCLLALRCSGNYLGVWFMPSAPLIPLTDGRLFRCRDGQNKGPTGPLHRLCHQSPAFLTGITLAHGYV